MSLFPFRRVGGLLIALSILPSAPASAQLSTTGRWASANEFVFKDPDPTSTAEVAIHLAVLRGRSDSTHVFYFTHGHETRLMLDAMAGPAARHVNVPYRDRCASDYFESFCAGHSTLGDGRLFVAGGSVNITGQAPSGSKFVGLFDARDYGSVSRGWTLPDAMLEGRYYPTCTTMPDGSALVTQGDEHFQMLTYGGYNSGDVVQRDARTYAITSASPFWRNENVIPVSTTWHHRVGHSANYLGGRITSVALFGGKNASGQVLQHLQFIYRQDTNDSQSDWKLFDTPPDAGDSPPDQRWFHAAAGAPGGTEVVIHGGQGQDHNGLIKDDLYRLQTTSGNYKWLKATVSGPARWRHTAVYDPGPAGSPKDSARILVFGGRSSATALADNAVWAARLTVTTPQWYVAVEANSNPMLAPAARERHGAFFQNNPGQTSPMAVIGGLDSNSTLRNDAWVLERPATSFTYTWRKLNVGNLPPARMDFSMSYDPERHILVIAGGDDNGEAPGGQLADAWGLPLDLCSTGGNPDWYQLPGMGTLGARSGHASTFVDLPAVKNPTIGRFSPSAPSGQQWKLLWWARKVMPHTYPFMFVLPNGHVAWVGPNGSGWGALTSLSVDKTMVLNPDSNSVSPSGGWQSTAWSNKGAWGGSAVLYSAAPDSVRVMKCGAHHAELGEDSTQTFVIAFGPDGGTEGWARVAATSGVLADRRDHNLVILPTGEVLVAGGRNRGQRSRVQIWNPDTRHWSAELAEDPRIRNYHSSAALLPDGRVLSVGGHNEPPADLADRTYATIYEPPYLFDGNSPSTRPQISSALARATHKQIVTVCVNDEQAIDRVALLRPAATTHAFDQNQRYIPLSFTRASGPSRLFVTMPLNANLAPPGDYLLFVCDESGGRLIPSEGRWISLHSPVGRDSCDVVAPTGGSTLALQTEACVPPSYGDIRLRWTAPGDDAMLGASGQVKSYDLRYVLNSGSPPPFETWTPWTVSVAEGAGATVQTIVGGLPNVWHRFALRPFDDNQNVAVMSNQVVARPQWCEDEFSGGSGGGGGSMTGEAASLVSLEGASSAAAPEYRENSLLHSLPVGTRGRDLLHLPASPRADAGTWSVLLRKAGPGGVSLGRARLLVADHEEGTEAVAGASGLLSGRLNPAIRVLDSQNRDRTPAASGRSSEPIHANAGEVLEAELPDGEVLVLEAHASDDPGSTGIQVEVTAEGGGWATVAKLHPRRHADRVALEGISASRVRLRFLGAHAVSYVGRLMDATPLVAADAALAGAASRRLGDVLPALVADDALTLTLAGPDSIQLSFLETPTPVGHVREFLLEVEGSRAASSGTRGARLVGGGQAYARPTLLPSIPNPAREQAKLRFALPEPSWVTLEVHDVQGRLITRFSGFHDAGIHVIDWDARNLSGERVRSGIYIQRLIVGGSQMERSIVVLR